MINAIGEATVQQFVRTSYNAETFDKDLAVQKTDKVRQHRPIEKGDNGQKAWNEFAFPGQYEITQ